MTSLLDLGQRIDLQAMLEYQQKMLSSMKWVLFPFGVGMVMLCTGCTSADVVQEVDENVQPRITVQPRIFDSVRITSAFVQTRAGSLVVNSGGKDFAIVLPNGIVPWGKAFAELRRGDRLSIDVRYNDRQGMVAMAVEYLGPGWLPQPTGNSASCSHKGGDRCR